MSRYLQYGDISFRDRKLLLAALADLGYADVEEGETLALYGYQGDRRSETAEIVVRRRHIGSASNDVGFARTPRGYVPIVSEFDARTLQGGQFLVRLRAAYAEHVVGEVQRRLHGTAHRTVEADVVKIRIRY